MTLLHPPRGETVHSDLRSYRLALFSRMWALAALFHLAGNARDALTTSPPLAGASILLGAAAAATLVARSPLWPLVALCALVPVTAWYEAPVVGNHWVLAAAVSILLLLVVGLTRGERGASAVWERFAPAARLTLLVAYAFAAFAKLNVDFLDPAVSCAVYFHNQLVQSWGLHLLSVPPGVDVGWVLGAGAAATELSVVVLLAVPRWRRIGIVLAVSFHWMLAMDLAQHFWDFSSVLFAVFLLFLDDAQIGTLRTRAARLAVARRDLTVAAVGVVTALVVVLAVVPVSLSGRVVLVLLGHVSWWAYGTALLLTAWLALRSPSQPRTGTSLRVPELALLLVPALVFVNGLTPYMEIKTGWGWNMYSNLRTVAGESNHLLVPVTLDLTGLQRDQVRILESSDPALVRMRDDQYMLPYSEFREYAQTHPDVSVTYQRGGVVVEADRLSDDAAGQGTVSQISSRLQSFRVIDASASERCQPTYTPAR